MQSYLNPVLYESRENVVGQYITFCKIYDEVRKEYGGGRETIEKVIEICLNERGNIS